MAAATLGGKSIVIVGGTGGMGAAAVQACVAAGASVVAVGRNPEHAAAVRRQVHGPLEILLADATDPDTAPRAVQLALDSFGRFDALYHVAGGSGRRWGDGPIHEVDWDGWRRTLQLNLDSAAYSMQAAIRQFLAQASGGTVLLMSSALAAYPAPRYFATHAYATAKSALIGLARAAAAYYAGKNIRVNVVAPGLMETPMSTRACSDADIMKYVRHRQPLDGHRAGAPTDVNDAVVYLLSEGAKFVTGQVLAVDGGWSVSDGALPE